MNTIQGGHLVTSDGIQLILSCVVRCNLQLALLAIRHRSVAIIYNHHGAESLTKKSSTPAAIL